MSINTFGFPTVAVLGMGTMGAGIAHVVAASGRQVIVLESDGVRSSAGQAAMTAFLDSSVTRGKITAEAKAQLLDRVRVSTATADLADVDLVIESVTENPDIKKAVLVQVAEVISAQTPLCTNTSALSVTDLAAAVPHPERVAGLHFFNPAPLMPIIEVISALQTAESLSDQLMAFVDTLDGKTAIAVKDRPGFLINALLMPYLNDVIAEYDDELATAEDIDLALKLGLGYKTGPLEMLDMIGLDVHLHGTGAAYAATRDDRYSPPPLLQRMVAAGRLGTKNGHGFRTHDNPQKDA